jgi:hypothetical protein
VGLAIAGAAAAQDETGLSVRRAKRYPNQTIGAYPRAEGDYLGWALAAGDFNGDGADDLAVGMPGDDQDDGRNDAGLVWVRYGLPGVGLEQSTLPPKLLEGIGPVAGDALGAALAACDFDGDGFDDLAMAASGAEVADVENAGAVVVQFGSSAGLTAESQRIPMLVDYNPGFPQQGSGTSMSLACGDFDHDGHADLAIGVPYRDDPFSTDNGLVVVVPGTATLLETDAASQFTQFSPFDELGYSFERFGYALAVGSFDGDIYPDLAIGAPFDWYQDEQWSWAGVLAGSVSGLSADRIESWSGVFHHDPGSGGGSALAAGDLDGDGLADLAIGAPLADDEGTGSVAPVVDAGTVTLLIGDGYPDLLAPLIRERGQGDLGGASATNDHFGFALAVGDYDGDGYADLAVGHPGETRDTNGDTGAVSTWMGSTNLDGSPRSATFTPGLGGVPGAPQALRRFGQALAVGDFDADGNDDLAVGAPFEDIFIGNINVITVPDVGAVYVLYGQRELHDDSFETGGAEHWTARQP